ncbi:MAG: glycosyl transferase group 1 [Chloroflexi bacterium]|jgi:glycosyltransferase involved in cell wall biosynthesis|nr:glycosyl transferase group 1 [Chloroflexota bacterium]
MARIGINAQLLTFSQSYRNAGSSAFIYHLLRNLPNTSTVHRYFVFTNARRAALPIGDNARFQVVGSRLDTERPAQRILWEQTALPLLLERKHIDVVHGTLNVLPVARRIPGVVTIHDVSFLLFPERFLPGRRRYLSTFTRVSARGARMVVASSENTRRDVIRLLGVPEERVRVVYLGVDDRFRERPDPDAIARFREQHALPEDFFLYVGTLEPRKNLVRLLNAYHVARQRGVEWPLVLAGGKGWLYEEVFQRVQDLNLTEFVRFPGYVLYEDLPLWYNAASAFVYPSLYEGFGLPVAEAMACGCPVLTTRNSSLIEVAGEATILVEGEDEVALADGLCRLAGDRALRAELSRLGLAQSAQFNWARTAADMAAVYDEALQEA